MPWNPGSYVRQTPTSASKPEELAMLSIRSLTRLVAPAETAPGSLQAEKASLSDKKVVERRRDAQRCSGIK